MDFIAALIASLIGAIFLASVFCIPLDESSMTEKEMKQCKICNIVIYIIAVFAILCFLFFDKYGQFILNVLILGN